MRSIVSFAILVACPAASLFAQAAPVTQAAPAEAARQRLPAGAQAEIVRSVIATVRKNYVHPERVDAIVKRLEAGLASGRYSTSNPAELSERMTADLHQSSGNDGHMYINFNPAESAARSRGPEAADAQQEQSFFREQMRASNHGITELKILPGNVRYMNISQWLWDPQTSPAVYEDAIRFLSGGDAIIIDVSRNGGGSAEAVEYLVSHFVEPGRKLMTFREGPTKVEEAFSQKVPASQLQGKPLFVLISSRSGSASEEFASHIRNFKLGTLIGKTTAGAGNPNTLFPIAHGFVLSVSTGLAMHPVTGKGWEGEGVAPHQETELSRALDLAHLGALKARLAVAPAEQRANLQWLISALSIDDTAPAPTAEQLRALAGVYQGGRQVSERAGHLFWRRADGPEVELVPLGGNRFAVGDRFGTRVEFGTADLTVQRPGGEPEKLPRTTQLSGR